MSWGELRGGVLLGQLFLQISVESVRAMPAIPTKSTHSRQIAPTSAAAEDSSAAGGEEAAAQKEAEEWVPDNFQKLHFILLETEFIIK